MARNGSGTYVVYTPGNPVVTGTTISSTAFNNTINDIATALTGSISADGQTPITANIPMNGKKLTGLGAPTVAGDALSYGGVIAGSTGAFTSSALGTQVIATNGGTTTLTSTSPYYTVFTGTFVQTVVLPDATTLTVGQQYGIDNDGALAITVKTNGGATLWTIASGCDLYLTLTAQATAVGTWETDYQGAQLATGKTLVVNNSVTVNGTDGTTMTLPATSATLARTDASQSFSGTQTFVDITTTGNTILGDASTDTLNVGNGGLVKDASGNVGIGVTPSAWKSAAKAIQFQGGSIYSAATTNFSMAQNGYINTSDVWTYSTTNLASLFSQNGGQHIWYTAPSGTAGTAITFTQAMTLNASGGCQHLNTISVGNATPSTSGAGITFPATQSASTDANTLDDYEEGTWTPTIVGLTTGGTASYSTQSGTYTKIGNLVTLVFSVAWTGHTGTGQLSVQGLPFAIGNVIGNYGSASVYANGLTITGQLFLETTVATSRLDAYAVNNGSASSLAMDAAANIECTVTYRA